MSVQPQVLLAADPRLLRGWDDLATQTSFYASSHWLSYADVDVQTTASYLTAHDLDGRCIAAVSSHWTVDEAEEYLPAHALGRSDAPAALTLGGRRAYLSSVLVAGRDDVDGAARRLAPLLTAAIAGAPQAEASWWWPYLDAGSAGIVQLAARYAGLESTVHLVSVDTVLDVTGTSVDEQISALPDGQRRTNARRERRAFAEAGLTVAEVDLRAMAGTLGPFLAQVQRKYGHPATDGGMTRLLQRQADMLGEHAVTLVCYLHDTPIGFSLLYRWGDQLALRVVGFDYDGLPGTAEYAELAFWAPVAYAQAHGIGSIHLGIDAYTAKCRRGGRVRPLWAVAALPPQEPEQRRAVVDRLGPLPGRESTILAEAISAERRVLNESVGSTN